MTETGGDVENVVGGAVFATLALILAAFTGWQLLTTLPGGLVGLLLGIVPGLLLALLLGLVGVWLFRRGPPVSYT